LSKLHFRKKQNKTDLHDIFFCARSPSVSGTAVIGVAFKGGVVLAADTVGSYGTLCKLRTIPRLLKVNDKTVLAVSGDYGDYQHIEQLIAKKS
jgi:20S proteasome alpha/beta subunit